MQARRHAAGEFRPIFADGSGASRTAGYLTVGKSGLDTS
jgi:hypothetical protein